MRQGNEFARRSGADRTSLKRGQFGFSALEMLVAVAILAAAFLPILLIQTQMLGAYDRQAGAYERLTLRRNAIAVLADLNPMEAPTGSISIGEGVTLSWRSTALSNEVISAAFPIGDGEFYVVLYKVEVEILSQSANWRDGFTVERVGWRMANLNQSPFNF